MECNKNILQRLEQYPVYHFEKLACLRIWIYIIVPAA